MPLDREKARAALLEIGVFDDGWNVSQPTVTEVLDAIEPYVTPRLAEVDARIVSNAEAKLARIRQLIRDDHLIEWMGTEYLPLNEVRAVLDAPS